MFLASDNAGPVHPSVMNRVIAANDAHQMPYGKDVIMDEVTTRIREVFEAPEAAVYLVATGTAANCAAQNASHVHATHSSTRAAISTTGQHAHDWTSRCQTTGQTANATRKQLRQHTQCHVLHHTAHGTAAQDARDNRHTVLDKKFHHNFNSL